MFSQAKPIWGKGAEGYNCFCGFIFTVKGKQKCAARIAACDAYQLYCNGVFVAAGPARCAKNHFRQDIISLGAFLSEGENKIVAVVAGYNVNSYEYAGGEPFLQLEITGSQGIIEQTDENTFVFDVFPHVQKTVRYSFQRTFTEVWDLNAEYTAMLRGEVAQKHALAAVLRDNKHILARKSPYPAYRSVSGKQTEGGRAEWNANAPRRPMGDPDCLTPRGNLRAFSQQETESNLYAAVCAFITQKKDGALTGAYSAGEYGLYDFGIDGCGFIGINVRVEQNSEIYILFDEILTEGDVDPLRLNCINCVKFQCAAGEYRALTFEPYTFRYAKLICAAGKIEVLDFYIREIADPRADALSFRCENAEFAKVFSAAVNSYRFNAVDIYMDCPSRERAGWLCDGYFTGRVERALTRTNDIEHDFLQNFLLNEREEFLPANMLPMCYPSEHTDGVFIPTWAMWYILEIDCYTRETNDFSLAQAAKNKLYRLVEFFKSYENEHGLLEDLPGWVFIEWSKAAEFTNGVNYCANMLYSLTLKTLGDLYRDEALCAKAAQMAQTVRAQSYNGQFFADHAVREGGKLAVCPQDITEVCQYYAFFTGVATPQAYPALWETLVRDFGPERKKNNKYPQIWFANAFIGNYLRLMLLERYGLYEQITREIGGYFIYMAEKTGTLWEHDSTCASCNHGFASYVARWLLLLKEKNIIA